MTKSTYRVRWYDYTENKAHSYSFDTLEEALTKANRLSSSSLERLSESGQRYTSKFKRTEEELATAAALDKL